MVCATHWRLLRLRIVANHPACVCVRSFNHVAHNTPTTLRGMHLLVVQSNIKPYIHFKACAILSNNATLRNSIAPRKSQGGKYRRYSTKHARSFWSLGFAKRTWRHPVRLVRGLSMGFASETRLCGWVEQRIYTMNYACPLAQSK